MRSTMARLSSAAGNFSERPRGRHPILLRLQVALHRQQLDRRIAEGAGAGEPEFLLRSCQLASRHERDGLSRGLLKLIEDAERVEQRPLSLAVPINAEAVLIWRDSILAIATRPEERGPGCAAGMARLRLLLTDGAGPLFNPRSEYLIADVVPRIEKGL